MRIHRRGVDCGHAAVEISRPLIEVRRHQLTVTLPPHPIMLNADPIRLAQILSNLLNNAGKYTEQSGHIWLTVALETGNAVFRVRDTGIGIPTEMLSKIFELFTQADRAGSFARWTGNRIDASTLPGGNAWWRGRRWRSEGAGRGSEFTVKKNKIPAVDQQLTGRPD